MADVKMKECDTKACEEPPYRQGEGTTRTTIFRGIVQGQMVEDIGPVCSAKLAGWLEQENIALRPVRKTKAQEDAAETEPESTPEEPPAGAETPTATDVD